MIIHIVKSNERLDDILIYYGISFDDLKVNNLHITDFKHIAPGTRLKIPTISEQTIQTLNETEPLVMDYYNNDAIIKENDTENESIINDNQSDYKFKGLNFIRNNKILRPRKSIYPFYRPNKEEDNEN